MASPRYTFEDHRPAICKDHHRGRDTGYSVVAEALRIVFVPGLGESISVGRRDHSPRLRACSACRGGEKVDPGRKIIPGGMQRTGPSSPARRPDGDDDGRQDHDNDGDPDTDLAHSMGTAPAIPIEFPLSTP